MEVKSVLFVLTLVLTINGDITSGSGIQDLGAEIAKAKQRLQKDFILNLWHGANEAISESQDKILTLYTKYTIQQAQHIVDHIAVHQNKTRTECAAKRSSALATKNLDKLVTMLQCIFTREEETLKTYKMTGYNLHNCIRMAQNELEGKYLKLVANLENIKNATLTTYDYYRRSIDNCVQKSCVLSNLFQSIIQYERLREDVSTSVTEINSASTKYVFSHIAMDCISSGLTQVSDNYSIGSDLADACFLPANVTTQEQGPKGEDVVEAQSSD